MKLKLKAAQESIGDLEAKLQVWIFILKVK